MESNSPSMNDESKDALAVFMRTLSNFLEMVSLSTILLLFRSFYEQMHASTLKHESTHLVGLSPSSKLDQK